MFNRISIAAFVLSLSIILYSCESNDSITNSGSSGTEINLLIPPDNAVINNLNPTFSWSAISTAQYYRLQISPTSSFSNIIFEKASVSSTSYTLTDAVLVDSNTYYWRVNGYSDADTSEWSAVSSFTVNTIAAVPNGKVLLELFTNTSCIPCLQPNHYLDNIFGNQGVTNNDAKVVILRAHTTLFPNDPFYLFNPTVNDARQTYYNAANANPRGFLLGANMGAFNSTNWTTLINSKLGSTTDYAITVSNNYNPAGNAGSLEVKVFQISGAQASDLRLFVALTENDLSYNAPNGEVHFDNTLRDMLNGINGEQINLTAGQSLSRTINYSVMSGINYQKAQLIIFIQDYSTREIFAVEVINVN
ncbi:MAG: Omp28-related outer membrane protein [Ignavibacteriaceae bacterium]|jgi:hypothetical protein|nr:MAG: hypothetical protein EDM69_06480 [Chlorobiota bacterium]KXK06338.1 MAG: 5'-nucleotidase [Chlorobi bacterium OLB4]MBV6399149.1 hypothetical protein [Ignavibacteria bacterium]MCC6885404.1 Omp28-related outer membrane protein [Ignavibacteriales bacterium]MCE7953647.1 hypothetical protein [Chlorobi bacterium CHB7]MDL1887463.1 Omp28-related outer membrane protein [Ignavibacteria bacterium CHB1]MEB2329937.1 Omp28-related outer membrane protein [Ignavibacteriaceae bacterium]OQY78350.1 MAG: 